MIVSLRRSNGRTVNEEIKSEYIPFRKLTIDSNVKEDVDPKILNHDQNENTIIKKKNTNKQPKEILKRVLQAARASCKNMSVLEAAGICASQALSKASIRYSIGTQYQKSNILENNFQEKCRFALGVEPISTISFTCRKGLKPDSPNQDSALIVYIPDGLSFYAIFDGHGPAGHEVSEFVKRHLAKLFYSAVANGLNTRDALHSSFATVQSALEHEDPNHIHLTKQINTKLSGTTATVIVVDHPGQQITIAHVGDSRAIAGLTFGKNEVLRHGIYAFDLTMDHRPEFPSERIRIEERGGRVDYDGYCNHRVFIKDSMYPGLNMSRALGDVLGNHYAGISAVSEILQFGLSNNEADNENYVIRYLETKSILSDRLTLFEDPLPTRLAPRFILLCSDGVWEFISSQEAVDIICKFPPEKSQEAVNELAKIAWNYWIDDSEANGISIVDDISVILVYIEFQTLGQVFCSDKVKS